MFKFTHNAINAMSKRSIIYFSIGVLFMFIVIVSFSYRKVMAIASPTEFKYDGKLPYKWSPPDVPQSMSFAGEKVPLEKQAIHEQMQRELLVNYYYHSSTLYILMQGGRYLPLIEERLKANGVPDDFKYLCIAESGLQQVTSKANAVGFWQFLKETGPKYGLVINDEVDERYNVAKSTDAACKYFKEAYSRFGSWTAAAASYNCGLTGFDNFSTFQQTKDYYQLQLPDETMRYIFRILAFKYILTGANKLGFIVVGDDLYKPYASKTMAVTKTIPDLAQFAIDNGTSYRTLKTLNPWLRNHSLTLKDGQSYEIQMPVNN